MTMNASAAIRALIVDDEPLAVDNVRAALEPDPHISVVGTSLGGRAAIDDIRELKPDLVFLDVQMPGLDGFGVIEEVGPRDMPEVVFITAYDQHALRAFEVNALDYVLKPFDDERFAECARHAVDRVRRRKAGELERALEGVLREIAPERGASGEKSDREPRSISRITVRDRDRVRFVAVDDLDFLEAAGNYVRLHAGAESHLIRATLSELDRQLDDRDFVRIHRSTIVNVHRIAEVRPYAGGDYLAILHDGRELRVSRTYRDDLLKPMA